MQEKADMVWALVKNAIPTHRFFESSKDRYTGRADIRTNGG